VFPHQGIFLVLDQFHIRHLDVGLDRLNFGKVIPQEVFGSEILSAYRSSAPMIKIGFLMSV
jgi:hypothetical protein